MVSGLFSNFAAATCSEGSFLGFNTWYHYLKLTSDCSPQISSLNDMWLIVAAVIEILLQVAALVAVVFVMIGGFNFVTSQGEPDRTSKARGAIINALIGLVIAVLAAVITGFIAGSIKK